MLNPSTKDRLRRNTQQLTYTLDFYPTLLSILLGGHDYLLQAADGCIHGVDLTTVDIPNKRVAISWNSLSWDSFVSVKHMWALSTKNTTLYHRNASYPVPFLQQKKEADYVLEFGECTRNTRPSNICSHTPTKDEYEYFRGAVQWIQDTSFLGMGIPSSIVVDYFARLEAP